MGTQVETLEFFEEKMIILKNLIFFKSNSKFPKIYIFRFFDVFFFKIVFFSKKFEFCRGLESSGTLVEVHKTSSKVPLDSNHRRRVSTRL